MGIPLKCFVHLTNPVFHQYCLAAAVAKRTGLLASRDECMALSSGDFTRLCKILEVPEVLARLFGDCVCEVVFRDPAQPSWHALPGAALDIAATDDTVWVIGTDASGGGYGIYRMASNDGAWERQPGGAVAIALENQTPWVVNNANEIFRWNGAGWECMPGAAIDIAAGDDGEVWAIGTNAAFGGHSIHRWDGNNWTTVPGGAERIAVDDDGNPWVANSQHLIFRGDGGSWHPVPGAARDLGAGDGGVWAVGIDPHPSGYGVYKWNGTTFDQAPGAGVRIEVGNDIYVVNNAHQIWCYR